MSGVRPRANTLTSTQSKILYDRWKCKMTEEKIEETIHMIRRTTISQPQTIATSIVKEPNYFYKPKS
ncbi:BV18 family protein [Diolcogaster facetosa bracovirus]|uniref:BV18 family protein n=2 Tax=Bracoviriform TaxID=2946836 RepID=R9XNE6_9VIRU|nr:BV18 family protein [Diolcogaster facetosa bracovirus] [Bracoviriform facetosae]AGO14360.1 BV18 family protein [Diolcogaster facetosa bracovirus] [Bracoviriform facetosae]AGO14434.1 BV18 family protein [Cotesia sesamiae Mombasa bracovirus]